MPFALKLGAVATPLALVTTVADPPNAPLGPLPGAANVTETPETGLPAASFTVACSAVANTALTTALWGVPAVAVMLAADPAVFVRLNVAGDATPLAVAVTEYAPAFPLAV